jgi:hypothetical protein
MFSVQAACAQATREASLLLAAETGANASDELATATTAGEATVRPQGEDVAAGASQNGNGPATEGTWGEILGLTRGAAACHAALSIFCVP